MIKKTNLASSLQKLKILLDLETIPGYNTILGTFILQSVYRKDPPEEIFDYIREQYKKHKKAVSEIIGDELALRILNLNKN